MFPQIRWPPQVQAQQICRSYLCHGCFAFMFHRHIPPLVQPGVDDLNEDGDDDVTSDSQEARPVYRQELV